ncbi:MAG TPA: hypothetical protein VFR18_00155 [Terriglobia bacterium]|nr:hypothetical protein [Terriglobia bacterium]
MHDERGLRLLFSLYGSSISELSTPFEQMRDLALAIARDNFPYFSAKKPKSSAWDSTMGARFLRDVQAEVSKGKALRLALNEIGRRLPRGLGNRDGETLLWRRRELRRRFSKLVEIMSDGSIQPLGEFEGRLWSSLLEDDPRLDRVRFVPDTDRPNAIQVINLPRARRRYRRSKSPERKNKPSG